MREKLPEKVLAKAFWSIIGHYELSNDEQAVILGINNMPSDLIKYKEEQSIPSSEDSYTRVAHLISIHRSLRILFPENREVVYKWLKTNRKEFSDMSAMNYILEASEDNDESLERLKNVRGILTSFVNS
jgi:hypothetical protein